MRIIAGAAKGRRLLSPPGGAKGPIRPTSDRAREALFSILGQRVQGAKVADLFAGTGAFALEALSRGAGSAVLVDSSPVAVSLIHKNAESCGFSSLIAVLQRDLSRGLAFLKKVEPSSFDIIFLDPPYDRNFQERALGEIAAGGLLSPGGLVIAEEQSGLSLPASFSGLFLRQTRCYGDTAFWFYEGPAEGETDLNRGPDCQKAAAGLS